MRCVVVCKKGCIILAMRTNESRKRQSEKMKKHWAEHPWDTRKKHHSEIPFDEKSVFAAVMTSAPVGGVTSMVLWAWMQVQQFRMDTPLAELESFVATELRDELGGQLHREAVLLMAATRLELRVDTLSLYTGYGKVFISTTLKRLARSGLSGAYVIDDTYGSLTFTLDCMVAAGQISRVSDGLYRDGGPKRGRPLKKLTES